MMKLQEVVKLIVQIDCMNQFLQHESKIQQDYSRIIDSLIIGFELGRNQNNVQQIFKYLYSFNQKVKVLDLTLLVKFQTVLQQFEQEQISYLAKSLKLDQNNYNEFIKRTESYVESFQYSINQSKIINEKQNSFQAGPINSQFGQKSIQKQAPEIEKIIIQNLQNGSKQQSQQNSQQQQLNQQEILKPQAHLSQQQNQQQLKWIQQQSGLKNQIPLNQQSQINQQIQQNDYSEIGNNNKQNIQITEIKKPQKLKKKLSNEQEIIFYLLLENYNMQIYSQLVSQLDCKICFDKVNDKTVFKLKQCGHFFHKNCLVQHGINQNDYPLKCPEINCKDICHEEFLQLFNKEQREKFDNISFKKFMLKNATQYFECSKCKTITELQNNDEVVFCFSCQDFYCKKCTKVIHDGDCGEEQFRRLAQRENYSQCSKCNHWVEKVYGCNHIKCICGHEFCYNCKKEWVKDQECKCIEQSGLNLQRLFFQQQMAQQFQHIQPQQQQPQQLQEQLQYQQQQQQKQLQEEQDVLSDDENEKHQGD